MATFTPPTYIRRYGKDGLWKYYDFPVGKVVLIQADDTVVEQATFTDAEMQAAKAGSGDFGKAVFRRGITYTITASEDTLLTAAGYTTS